MTWLDDLTDDERSVLRPAPMPTSFAPMLATTARGSAIGRDGWVFERKLDGQRIVALCHGADVALRSRTDKSADAAYPEVVDALHEQVRSDCVLDGEVVAFDGERTSFSLLQGRMHQGDEQVSRRAEVPVVYVVFDVVHLDGIDLTRLPLRRRSALVHEAVDPGGPLRITEHSDDGEALFATACAHGWEGVIGKRADSTYQSRRSTDWLKFKCEAGQEMVIGGWTDPQGSRSDLGAVLVGHVVDGELVYAGKVGTGFDDRTLRDLGARLRAREVQSSPFVAHPSIPRSGVHWAEPGLVAQIGFGEWTPDGRLRHPRFQGLRDDKDWREVVREQV